MGKLNDLEPLTGKENLPEDALTSGTWGCNVKTRYIYEGTDSEEEEIPLSRTLDNKGSSSHMNPGTESGQTVKDFKGYQLQHGELAAEHEVFVPWQAIKKYPYNFMGKASRERVSKQYFDQGKVYNSIWDFFYLYRPSHDANQSPMILVPTKQFEAFLKAINQQLGVNLRIPLGSSNNSGFRATFPNEGTPRPRYLGRTTNRALADKLHADIPPSNFKLDGEPEVVEVPSQKALVAFKAKVDSMAMAYKRKKEEKKEKKQVDLAAKQESWNQSIKRVQRYLGIRHLSLAQESEIVRAKLQTRNLQWMDYDEAFRDAMLNLPPPIDFDAEKPAAYNHAESIIFVCVDVEAYERNTRQITEIGIATLDTKDIKSIKPGDGGVNWRAMIRARHFRINEHKHLVNKDFVHGCADRFEFGESEFISLKDAPHVVSTCFKHPFSKKGPVSPADEVQKQNIVLVGHDVQADVRFLRTVGYDVYTLSTLLETADTSLMWRYHTEENNPRNLATILVDLGITAWNLHNAGNDAVYTLQALIAIVIKSLTEEQTRKKKEEGKHDQTVDSVNQALAGTVINEDSVDESDGGARISPVRKVQEATNALPHDIQYEEAVKRPEETGYNYFDMPV